MAFWVDGAANARTRSWKGAKAGGRKGVGLRSLEYFSKCKDKVMEGPRASSQNAL